MDAKQSELLTDLHARMVTGDFGETEVHSLLALLRDDAPGGGPVRELGDFVAHRERDRGHVHRYLGGVKAILDRLGTRDEVLRVQVVFSETDIARALDAALAMHSLQPLTAQRHLQVQLAILSMLQGVAIVDESGRQFGTLELTFTRDHVQLLGVVTLAKPPGVRACFPALTVTNDCYPMHNANAQVRPTKLLKVAVHGGATVLEGVKSFEIHVGRKKEYGAAAPAEITWQEVEDALAGLPVMAARADAGEFDVPAADRTPVTFRLRHGRLSFSGLPAYFATESPVWRCALVLKQRLGARVYDDTGGYLFETAESLGTLEPE